MAQLLINSILSNHPSNFVSSDQQSGDQRKQVFVDSKIATKFGKFNIRIYADAPGKETMVLWTDHMDTASPVLVRVHSECMTGDVIGSLQCDCGEQLAKALRLFNKEGGILIYLRQEGRGIGLFNKIKTYQLQSKGYDTFEANVLIGHKPDARTYEMVKTVLDDLNVHRIKLLTNNPSKVSELAKLGIEVTERVPLIIRANPYNKRYFETKQRKFKHLFGTDPKHYFYQFPVQTVQQIVQIAQFIQDKKRDPLLKFYVGISADSSLFAAEEGIEKVRALVQAARRSHDLVPVLHFSFRLSTDVIKDLEKIKKMLPEVEQVQLNDLPPPFTNYIKVACSLFSIDLPLSDDTFDCIENNQVRNLIKKYKLFVLLDNSKGRGIQESKESLMKKIDVLLNYGINDIGLSGGFGPDELQNYFEIRRFYKINFSIDAETKLKSDQEVDIRKVERYLTQLLDFNQVPLN